MRPTHSSILLVILLSVFSTLQLQSSTVQFKPQGPRDIYPMDKDWKFSLSDQNDAKEIKYDDSDWRRLDIPHDWSIEMEYDRESPVGRGGGYLPAGTGWYRRSLLLHETESGRKHFIQFDGVMANCDVWINGQHLGKRPYGYTSFAYELTGKLTFGAKKPNIIAVRVDNSNQPASRWYAGAGIYRHVRLVSLNPVHFDRWGIFITTPEVKSNNAKVKLDVKVYNQSLKDEQLSIQTTLFSPDGKSIASASTPLKVEKGLRSTCTQEITVPEPHLWSTENPNIYTAETKIISGKTIVDVQKNNFGIRSFRFESETGFWLNDKNMKILGVCLHQDAGPVGVAVPLSVWERRLIKLKEIGVNAIRTAHNPMDPGFYDLCDKMGFLVMDETFDTWTVAKPGATTGYNLYFNEWWEADTRDMVMRDRNHPCIILYSVGNEIRDRLDREDGRQRFINQRDLVHKLDPTRPVTMALFRPNEYQVYNNGFSELMDVVGQNYRENELVAAWKDKPGRKVIGTENRHENTAWLVLRDNPFMAGQFLWTGIDYLGEAGWPEISWGSALLDRNGFMKTTGYERQSWWSKKPMVKIARSEDNAGKGVLKMDWTPADFGTYDEAIVFVYSNCEEVELFLNGESKGRLKINQDASPRFWNIGFDPGTIKAVGYNNGKEVALDEMTTADRPVKLDIKAEKKSVRNSREDLVYVNVSVVDNKGVLNPNFNPKIKFSIEGPGKIVAVDNGDILSHEKYASDERTAFNGKAVVLIRATSYEGVIKIKASAQDLGEASTEINAVPAE